MSRLIVMSVGGARSARYGTQDERGRRYAELRHPSRHYVGVAARCYTPDSPTIEQIHEGRA